MSSRVSKREAWELSQKKTFCRWVNSNLPADSQLSYEQLEEQLKDGYALLRLLAKIFDEPNIAPKLPPKQSSNRIYQLQAVGKALDHLKKKGIRLDNVGAEDIVNGNTKLILGLLWRLVCYSLDNMKIESSELLSDLADSSKSKKSSVDLLLDWCRNTVAPLGLDVANFTTSFMDGRVFVGLLHACALSYGHVHLIPFSGIKSVNAKQNLQLAFSFANKYWGVSQLLDADEVCEAPDDKSIVTYVTTLYQALKQGPQIQTSKSRKEGASGSAVRTVILSDAFNKGPAQTAMPAKKTKSYKYMEKKNGAQGTDTTGEKSATSAEGASGAAQVAEEHAEGQEEEYEFDAEFDPEHFAYVDEDGNEIVYVDEEGRQIVFDQDGNAVYLDELQKKYDEKHTESGGVAASVSSEEAQRASVALSGSSSAQVPAVSVPMEQVSVVRREGYINERGIFVVESGSADDRKAHGGKVVHQGALTGLGRNGFVDANGIFHQYITQSTQGVFTESVPVGFIDEAGQFVRFADVRGGEAYAGGSARSGALNRPNGAKAALGLPLIVSFVDPTSLREGYITPEGQFIDGRGPPGSRQGYLDSHCNFHQAISVSASGEVLEMVPVGFVDSTGVFHRNDDVRVEDGSHDLASVEIGKASRHGYVDVSAIFRPYIPGQAVPVSAKRMDGYTDANGFFYQYVMKPDGAVEAVSMGVVGSDGVLSRFGNAKIESGAMIVSGRKIGDVILSGKPSEAESALPSADMVGFVDKDMIFHSVADDTKVPGSSIWAEGFVDTNGVFHQFVITADGIKQALPVGYIDADGVYHKYEAVGVQNGVVTVAGNKVGTALTGGVGQLVRDGYVDANGVFVAHTSESKMSVPEESRSFDGYLDSTGTFFQHVARADGQVEAIPVGFVGAEGTFTKYDGVLVSEDGHVTVGATLAGTIAKAQLEPVEASPLRFFKGNGYIDATGSFVESTGQSLPPEDRLCDGFVDTHGIFNLFVTKSDGTISAVPIGAVGASSSLEPFDNVKIAEDGGVLVGGYKVGNVAKLVNLLGQAVKQGYVDRANVFHSHSGAHVPMGDKQFDGFIDASGVFFQPTLLTNGKTECLPVGFLTADGVFHLYENVVAHEGTLYISGKPVGSLNLAYQLPSGETVWTAAKTQVEKNGYIDTNSVFQPYNGSFDTRTKNSSKLADGFMDSNRTFYQLSVRPDGATEYVPVGFVEEDGTFNMYDNVDMSGGQVAVMGLQVGAPSHGAPIGKASRHGYVDVNTNKFVAYIAGSETAVAASQKKFDGFVDANGMFYQVLQRPNGVIEAIPIGYVTESGELKLHNNTKVTDAVVTIGNIKAGVPKNDLSNRGIAFVPRCAAAVALETALEGYIDSTGSWREPTEETKDSDKTILGFLDANKLFWAKVVLPDDSVAHVPIGYIENAGLHFFENVNIDNGVIRTAGNKVGSVAAISNAPIFGSDGTKAEDWGEFKTEQGETYYHNRKTGETQWDKPEALLLLEKFKAQGGVVRGDISVQVNANNRVTSVALKNTFITTESSSAEGADGSASADSAFETTGTDTAVASLLSAMSVSETAKDTSSQSKSSLGASLAARRGPLTPLESLKAAMKAASQLDDDPFAPLASSGHSRILSQGTGGISADGWVKGDTNAGIAGADDDDDDLIWGKGSKKANKPAGPTVPTIHGAWTQRSAGGSADYHTFRLNPSYDLTTDRAMQIRITLRKQTGADVRTSVGFYVIRPEPGVWAYSLPLKKEAIVAFAQHSNHRSEVFVDLDLDGTEGRLLVIPTTLKPGERAEFQLEVTNAADKTKNEGITLKPSPIPGPYKTRFVFSGEWTKTSSGGMQDLPTWRQNPQYMLRIARPGCRVAVLLTQDPNQIRSMSTHIVSNQGDDKSETITVSNVLIGRPEKMTASQKVISYSTWNEATVEVTLPPKKYLYFIVPSCWEPGQEGRYLLTVLCEDPDAQMKLAQLVVPFPNKVTIESEWKGRSSGGNFNEPTWRNNPQFRVVATRRTRMTVILSRATWTFKHEGDIQYMADRDVGMSFHVVQNSNARYIAEVLPSYRLLGAPPAYIQHSEVGIDVTIEDPFTPTFIVPSTFVPNYDLPFRLTVLSEFPVQLVPAARDWKTRKGIQAEWEGDLAGGSREHVTWRNNPKFRLMSKFDAYVTSAILTQLGDTRLNIGLEVLANRDKNFTTTLLPTHDVVAELRDGEFTHFGKREVSLEFKMTANVAYFIVPSTYEPGEECPFQITVLAADNPDIRMDPLPLAGEASALSEKHIEDGWMGESAGGNSQLPTFFNNPQYRLKVRQQTQASVQLCQTGGTELNVNLLIFRAKPTAKVEQGFTAATRSQYEKFAEYRDGEFTYVAASDISVEGMFNVGDYIAVPSAYDAGESGSYTISVLSMQPVEFTRIR